MFSVQVMYLSELINNYWNWEGYGYFFFLQDVTIINGQTLKADSAHQNNGGTLHKIFL